MVTMFMCYMEARFEHEFDGDFHIGAVIVDIVGVVMTGIAAYNIAKLCI